MSRRGPAALIRPRLFGGAGGRALCATALALLLAVFLAACGEPLATPEPVFLRAAGSTSMSQVVAGLAEAFHGQSPAVSLEVQGLGTQFGLDALRSGEVDLALASWPPPDGSDPNLRATAIARDGIAVVVHPSNPVEGLGLLQLRDLFSGRTGVWRALETSSAPGLVQPVSREGGSGTRAAFEALVMEDLAVTPRAWVATSSQAVADYVAQDPQAIGYVSLGHVPPEVKVLSVEGVLPTTETVALGTYPLTRELWLVTLEPPSEAVQAFLDFALSAAGQEIVGRRYGRVR